ncbi:MAG: hypothetical protein GX561_07800 [Lentisphaerae bacterium]|jgi:hypothetical protein|nr:hypothetical protein [Lentisphaerota bacterium]
MAVLLFVLLVLCAGLSFGDTPYRWDVCLNGLWDIAYGNDASEYGDRLSWRESKVPSSWNVTTTWAIHPEAASSKVAWHRLRVDIPSSWRGNRVKLMFELLNASHSVRVNGRLLHELPHTMGNLTVDVTEAVAFGGSNEIVVMTKSEVRGRAGILRDVRMLCVPSTSIRYALVTPSVRKGTLSVLAKLDGEGDVELRCRVFDGDQCVLDLGSTRAKLSGSGACELSSPWKNPVLWGYGEYGEAKLYTMRTELLRNGAVIDVKHDRFGFREFYAGGDKFYLNKKPIFLLGDLYTKTRDHTEHPAVAIAFLQRMRDSNINFFRWHTSSVCDYGVWFDAADEVGFLMQPEMIRPFYHGKERLAANHPAVRQMWENYVTTHYNHPSIVSWCVDNESFSVGLTSLANIRKVNLDRMRQYDELISFIRGLDGSRIIEINHNYSLWSFVRMGKFSRENFEVFNIHPYGNILHVINVEQKAVGFKGEVPVLVGEIFAHGKPIDFLQDPLGAYAEQWRIGASYARQIREAKAARHVAGAILCAQTGTGFIGFSGPKSVHFGPWDDFAKVLDDSGKLVGLREFNVLPRWPSLSGPGIKVDHFVGWAYYGGNFGLNLNWFDPSVPMFRKNLVDEQIAESFRELNGGDVGGIPSRRCPEVVVGLGDGGIPFSNGLLWLQDKRYPGELRGVLTDRDGTGWFRLWGAGEYELRYGDRVKELSIKECPVLDMKAGYGYITWVDWGGIDLNRRREELRKPVGKWVFNEQSLGELLKNRDFEYWEHDRQASCWSYASERMEDCTSGRYSGKIVGSTSYVVQRIRMQKGKTYRISADIKKLKGNSHGSIQITAEQYKMLFNKRCEAKEGEWGRVEALHVATGDEFYFYLRNYYMGNDGEVIYDNASAVLVEEAAPQPEPFAPGPFKLSKDGFIRDFLVLGPFPNMGDELNGYQAATTDYLGGEATYQAKFGAKANAVFQPGFYWMPGEYEVRWDQLHSESDRIHLNQIRLEDAVVTGEPPTHVCAYLACDVISPVERDMRLGMGSDDGYVLWLNGEKLGASLTSRAAAKDQEMISGKLKAGRNRLLVKAIQEAGGWQMLIRLLDAQGKPLDNVEIVLDK